jgi:RNA polymerase sigma factor (sigma-70 family)
MDPANPDRPLPLEVTSTSLLEGLLDPQNDRVWTEFFERYGPIVRGFARKCGLREHEADDAVQETMVTFVTKYREGAYDREKGRLRSWLCGLANHKVQHLLSRRQGRERDTDGRDDRNRALESVPDVDHAAAMWETEWRRAVVRHCLDLIRDESDPVRLRAFELYTLQGWSAEEVATELRISRNMVYLSKSRVLARIAELREQIDHAWQEGILL